MACQIKAAGRPNRGDEGYVAIFGSSGSAIKRILRELRALVIYRDGTSYHVVFRLPFHLCFCSLQVWRYDVLPGEIGRRKWTCDGCKLLQRRSASDTPLLRAVLTAFNSALRLATSLNTTFRSGVR